MNKKIEEIVEKVRSLVDKETRGFADSEYILCLEEIVADIEMSIDCKKSEIGD